MVRNSFMYYYHSLLASSILLQQQTIQNLCLYVYNILQRCYATYNVDEITMLEKNRLLSKYL